MCLKCHENFKISEKPKRSKAELEILSILQDDDACRRIGITDFKRVVLLATLDIPVGSTMTYGELAEKIGKPGSGRAVGNALHSNPWIIVVPCHRVVPADFPHSVGGYRYGDDLKRSLLDRESITTSTVS